MQLSSEYFSMKKSFSNFILQKIQFLILYWYPGLGLVCTKLLALAQMYCNGNVCSHVHMGCPHHTNVILLFKIHFRNLLPKCNLMMGL